MKCHRISAVLLLTAGLVLAPPAHAAYDAFLKIDGVPGESGDPRHMGWIEVSSSQLDQIRNASTIGSATGGAGAGKAKFAEFTIRKRTDKASPKLFEAATKGKHFPQVVIEMRKAGAVQQEYLVIKLENVLVSSFRAGGPRGEGPEESMLLSFTKITYENTPFDAPHPGANAQLEPGSASGAIVNARTITKVTSSAAAANTGQFLTFTVEGIGTCDRSAIDYGDGTIKEFPFVSGKSTPAPTHAYAKAGTFEVKVWGRGDAWAHLTSAPHPNEVVCTGHATTSVAIKYVLSVAPTVKKAP